MIQTELIDKTETQEIENKLTVTKGETAEGAGQTRSLELADKNSCA